MRNENHPGSNPIRRIVEATPRRLRVLGFGALLGAVFSLWVAVAMAPESWGVSSRSFAWASVMSGPAGLLALKVAPYHPSVSLGWLGLLLILAHPWRPGVVTGVATILGLVLWFFAGFVAFMVVTWGA